MSEFSLEHSPLPYTGSTQSLEDIEKKEGKVSAFKKILTKDYDKIFKRGFDVRDIDERYDHLPVAARAQLITRVIEALDHVERLSSVEKNKRIQEIMDNQDKQFAAGMKGARGTKYQDRLSRKKKKNQKRRKLQTTK